MAVTAEQVLAALKELKDPSSGRPMSELGYFKHPELLEGGGVRVRVELPTPASPHKARIEDGGCAPLSRRCSSRAWRSLSTPTCGRRRRSSTTPTTCFPR